MIDTELRRRSMRGIGVLALSLVLGGGLAACVAAAPPQPSGDGLDTANEQTTFDDWNRDFTACMQDQGVELPSGGAEGSGDGQATMVDPGEVDFAALAAARDTCYDEVGEPPVNPDDPTQEQRSEAELEFAACMRDAGYDFPDPDPSSGGTSVMIVPDDVDPEVMGSCRQEAGLSGAAS